MTSDQLKAALVACGINQAEFGRRLRKPPNTVSRWCIGELPVPGYVEYVLELMRENAQFRQAAPVTDEPLQIAQEASHV